MGRPSKPWYWKERKGYAATVGGRRRMLARGPEDAATRARAARELHRILAEEPSPEPKADEKGITVDELATRFLDASVGSLRPATLETYRRRLREFRSVHGRSPAAEIRPRHVNEWLASRAWSEGTRRTALIIVQRAFSWARKQGHIDANPTEGIEKPREARREAIPSSAAIEALTAAAPNRQFAEFLEAIVKTGCRPGEAARVEARHVNLDAGTWTFEGKTTRKTGRMRVVYLTPKLVEVCRRLCVEHPAGPIFRNTQGNPWRTEAYAGQIRRLRIKLGLGPEVVAYGLRHLWITDALERGVPIATVAELAGHASTAMIARVYSHLSDRSAHLREAVSRIRPED